MNDAIVHFAIGSCPLITIYPYFILYQSYNRLSEEEKSNVNVSFSTLCITLPILYGILFAVVYHLSSFIPRKVNNSIYLRFVVTGALSSMLVSIFLDYVFNVHRQCLHIDNTMMYHIIVFVFYLVLYYTIGQWFRAQLLYGPGAPTPSFFPKSNSPALVSKPVPPPSKPIVSTPLTTQQQSSMTKLDEIQSKLNK